MSQPKKSSAPRKLTVPTAPQGIEVASFSGYLEAQAAVDLLSDKAFPVQHVTIVGNDLMMVERVTGRLTYGRVAMAGVAAGAWFGLFVGILLYLFASDAQGPGVFAAIAIGAGFGGLFSIISYSFTGGKRDFTSSSQIVASVYTVLCAAEHAGPARTLLAEAGMDKHVPKRGGGSGPLIGTQAPIQPAQPAQPAHSAPLAQPGGAPSWGGAAPSPTSDAPRDAADGGSASEPAAGQGSDTPKAPDSMYITPDGRPRYGVRTDAPRPPAQD